MNNIFLRRLAIAAMLLAAYFAVLFVKNGFFRMPPQENIISAEAPLIPEAESPAGAQLPGTK